MGSPSQEDSPEVTFLKFAFNSFINTILWLPVFTFRFLVIKFVASYKPKYGKILDAFDSTLEEPFTTIPPKNTIAFTIILEGNLKLKELQDLFKRNVLEAKISNKDKTEDVLRYPEYKQYQKDFLGFRFWKNDPTFTIENHITEQTYSDSFPSIAKIHQDYINKLYEKERSPWEIVVVRNYENSNKTLLIYRSHHTLGDTKSLLKVIIECLGEKELKLPNVQYAKYSLLDSIKYYALLPYYFVHVQILGYKIGLKAESNPWFLNDPEEPLLNIDISPKMSMKDIKAIAKKNGVTTSAVIMTIVAGAIAKSDDRFTKSGIPCQYVLPKPNHPNKLANYSYSGVMTLPTDIMQPTDLLKECNKIFSDLKTSVLYKYDKSVIYQLGTWCNPMRVKYLKNVTFPLIVTNIASDTEGFKVGSHPCVEFLMTCAPLPGACGVIICPFSYKDGIEISVTAKNEILDEAQNKALVDLMAKEYENLKNLAN